MSRHAKDKPTFSDVERRVLAMVQDDLPDSATPFADLAQACGATEEQVLELLGGLKEQGVIRRFGATLRHQKAGYGHNAMVAWLVPEGRDADEIGKVMAARTEISHCYRRVSYPEWPYQLYTMIHGQNPGDCLRVVEELARETGIKDHEVLESLRELKKISMRYFEDHRATPSTPGEPA